MRPGSHNSLVEGITLKRASSATISVLSQERFHLRGATPLFSLQRRHVIWRPVRRHAWVNAKFQEHRYGSDSFRLSAFKGFVAEVRPCQHENCCFTVDLKNGSIPISSRRKLSDSASHPAALRNTD